MMTIHDQQTLETGTWHCVLIMSTVLMLFYISLQRISLVSSFVASLLLGDYAAIDNSDGRQIALLDCFHMKAKCNLNDHSNCALCSHVKTDIDHLMILYIFADLNFRVTWSFGEGSEIFRENFHLIAYYVCIVTWKLLTWNVLSISKIWS